jgi:hypothetical protein
MNHSGFLPETNSQKQLQPRSKQFPDWDLLPKLK